MNKAAVLTIVFVSVVVASIAVDSGAQQKAGLIINPMIKSTAGAIPIHGSKPVRTDTLAEYPPGSGTTSWPGRTYFEGAEKRTGPASVLIVGFVPDPSRRWAVAYTHDAQEFEEALPEYLMLKSEGRHDEARAKLFISDDIAVSTMVEEYVDHRKIRDLPEKAGSFHMIVGNSICERYGYHLTFLSYDPDPQKRLQHYGPDLGKHVHGSVRLRVEDGDNGRGVLVMDVIDADMKEVEEK